MNFKKGFTAIELLIVLAIMIILIGIVIRGVNLSRERTRDGVRISDMQNIMLALEQYQSVCRAYPPELTLTASTPGCDRQLEDFLPEIPMQPNNEPYGYVGTTKAVSSNRCTGYHMWALLETKHGFLDSDSDTDTDRPTGLCRHTDGSSPTGYNAEAEASSDEHTYDISK